jgi:hypothetical protein
MEEQLSPGEGMYPYQVPTQRIGSTKFVSLKKNSLVVAQANSVPGSLPTSTNPLTGAPSFVGLPQQPQAQGSLGYATAPVANSAQSASTLQSNKNGFVQVIDELGDTISTELSLLGAGFSIIAKIIVNALTTVVNAVKNGVTNLIQVIGEAFSKIIEELKKKVSELAAAFAKNVVKPITNVLSSGSGDVGHYSSINDQFVKLAQYNPQTSTAGFDTQRWLGLISPVVVILVTALGAAKFRDAVIKLARASDFSTLINLVGPALLFVKNFVIECWQQASKLGWGYTAPTSAEYYTQSTTSPGTFSAEGLRRLYNNQQVRIALGISNVEDMALARAQKQRAENMATVRTQTEILQKNMDQNVYLGGKSDVAPGAVPNDLKNKIDVFLKFVRSVQDGAQAEYLILKKAIDRVYNKLDPMQKIQAQNLLSEIRNDMSVLQSLISEYSSSALVMDHIQRKRKLMMKLGPSLKRLQALEGLGISKAALITGSNGILQQLSRVRHEEASALQKLRKEYLEKMQLLERPDIAQREFAIPTDTTSIRLPIPPLPPTTPTSV